MVQAKQDRVKKTGKSDKIRRKFGGFLADFRYPNPRILNSGKNRYPKIRGFRISEKTDFPKSADFELWRKTDIRKSADSK
jgi:hypothetical protein